jgi:hypothetical protein
MAARTGNIAFDCDDVLKLREKLASRGKVQVTAQDKRADRSVTDCLDRQSMRVHGLLNRIAGSGRHQLRSADHIKATSRPLPAKMR